MLTLLLKKLVAPINTFLWQNNRMDICDSRRCGRLCHFLSVLQKPV